MCNVMRCHPLEQVRTMIFCLKWHKPTTETQITQQMFIYNQLPVTAEQQDLESDPITARSEILMADNSVQYFFFQQ